MKRPSFQFYPNDWLSNAELRMCSLPARGLWIEMICIMHGCVPYGYLSINGKDIHASILSRRVGESQEETERLLAELAEYGVFSRTSQGTIFSPRMVRDESQREARAAGGIKSLDNPNVPRRKASSESVSKDTFDPSPSYSVSSSSSSLKTSLSAAEEKQISEKQSAESLFRLEFEELWAVYPRRSGANGKTPAYRAYVAHRKRGVGAREILEGVKRYAAYVKATAIEATEYVKMAKSFLGPDDFYAERWDIPRILAKNSADGQSSSAVGSRILVATELIRKVKNAATEHIPYSGARTFPAGWENSFSDPETRVIKAFGPSRILSDPNEGMLVSQLAKALAEVE